MSLRLEDYDFRLPESQIAQAPAETREAARLLCVERRGDGLVDSRVAALLQHLRGDEAFVVNDSRVVPARLRARKESGGGVELLTLPAPPGSPPDQRWAMFRCSGALRQGVVLTIEGGGPPLEVLAVEHGRALLRFPPAQGGGHDGAREVLEAWGEVPLPPYIERKDAGGPGPADRERYQTVYASKQRGGSIAAPTAGLHFTPELLASLAGRGIPVIRVALHVGPGTFEPVRTSQLQDHRVEGEWVEVDAEAANALAQARAEGRRVIAVGTTSTRVLESVADESGVVPAYSGMASLTILPGYRFRVVEGLLTNFHLPKSSLLVLVSAFAGRERVLRAYEHAVREGYRFYSYGDAMLLQ